MKLFTWLWLTFFVFCLFLDGLVLWSLRAQLAQGLELALDAAVIAGLSAEDLSLGKNFIDEKKADMAAEQLLMSNLAKRIRNQVQIDIQYEQDGNCARIQAVAAVPVPLLISKYLGFADYELKVKKIMNYQNVYK